MDFFGQCIHLQDYLLSDTLLSRQPIPRPALTSDLQRMDSGADAASKLSCAMEQGALQPLGVPQWGDVG